ncbi:MAG TPA: AgmX/PglI C-terminal domain-containing protein [Polyangiaceae bacterium]|nr:AgmX/PglI C-terminal domain-containing protein [Polyangiaceae bacterium]
MANGSADEARDGEAHDGEAHDGEAHEGEAREREAASASEACESEARDGEAASASEGCESEAHDGEAANASEGCESEAARAPEAAGAGGRRRRIALIMGLSALAHLGALGVTAFARPSAALTEGEIVRRDYLVKLSALAHADASRDGAARERGPRGAGADAREGGAREPRGAGPAQAPEAPGPRDASSGLPGDAAMGPLAPGLEGARGGDDAGPVAIEAAGAPRRCSGKGRCRGGAKRDGLAKVVSLAGVMHPNGALHPEVVRRVVRQDFEKFRMCYENGLAGDPGLAGRVTVRFVIGRDGAVARAYNGGSDLPDAKVVACVVRAFGGLIFPRPEGGDVTVTFPLAFTTT